MTLISVPSAPKRAAAATSSSTVRAARRCADAAQAVASYCEADAAADIDTLVAILHPTWVAKRANLGAAAEVESRAEFLARVKARGPQDGELPDLSTLHMCFSDFAIARIEDWSTASVSLLLLFKERSAWRIAGEASASAAVGARDAHFRARPEEAAVLAVLEDYYRAVTEGDPQTIQNIFAPFWHMKNHQEDAIVPEDASVVAEGVEAFLARIVPGPLPGYWDDRQIADIQIVADRLAFVRVDKPSTPSTTVFLFMKLAGVWKVIDKAWTDGRTSR